MAVLRQETEPRRDDETLDALKAELMEPYQVVVEQAGVMLVSMPACRRSRGILGCAPGKPYWSAPESNGDGTRHKKRD